MRYVFGTFSTGARAAFSASALAAVVATAACSGGGSSGSPAMPAGPAPSAPPPANTASVTFKIKWPAATASSAARGRTPHYLPATALSASISVNGGMAQYINSPTSTLTFPAPVGLDTFLVKTYDEQNGDGNVLSTANITQTVSGSTANVVSATLNGVIASLSVVLSTYTTPAGALRNVAVAVNGLDADGNTIVGPADYNTPITLAIVDPANSGTLSITKKFFQAPSTGATLTYSGGSLWSASIVVSANGVPSASATFAPTPTFKQFSLAGKTIAPQQLTAGPDGNIWFTDLATNSIGKITPAGVITEYPVLTPNAQPEGITAASDGRLWFTEFAASKIGAITATGTVTESPTVFGNSAPWSIVDRGDGNVWYTGDADGTIESLPLAGGSATLDVDYGYNGGGGLMGIAVAPNRDIAFVNVFADQVGRDTVQFENYVVSVGLPANAGPQYIVLGPDGNFWFTENSSSQIGMISPLGFTSVTQYRTPYFPSEPAGITAGTDGALWFTEYIGNRIGRITTSGVITEYQLPNSLNVGLGGITTAKDGSLWFAETAAQGAIGHLMY